MWICLRHIIWRSFSISSCFPGKLTRLVFLGSIFGEWDILPLVVRLRVQVKITCSAVKELSSYCGIIFVSHFWARDWTFWAYELYFVEKWLLNKNLFWMLHVYYYACKYTVVQMYSFAIPCSVCTQVHLHTYSTWQCYNESQCSQSENCNVISITMLLLFCLQSVHYWFLWQ